MSNRVACRSHCVCCLQQTKVTTGEIRTRFARESHDVPPSFQVATVPFWHRADAKRHGGTLLAPVHFACCIGAWGPAAAVGKSSLADSVIWRVLHVLVQSSPCPTTGITHVF